jgi:pectate lyase
MRNKTIPAILILVLASTVHAADTHDANDSTKYLNAVRTFADNVLKYGRDTYGPKHTPLFVDGLNIHTREPVKWIDPNETKWILSNLASQQTLMRTLDGLTEITGDLKYRQAAMDAIRYAFDHLRTPSGLFYWGQLTAYDALRDTIGGKKTGTSFKLHYPYYDLMWEVDPAATKKLIEAMWSAHVIDWSNLDYDRGIRFNDPLEEPWDHDYINNLIFFESKRGGARGFFTTGTSLVQAATTLYRLSNDERPLIWSKRLIERFVNTRHPETGIATACYNNLRSNPLASDLKEHFQDRRTRFFPYVPFEEARGKYYPEDAEANDWISLFMVSETLGTEGRQFRQWALEELTAWGKAGYRKEDNSFVPMLTDGTKIEGYVSKFNETFAPKGAVAKPFFANLGLFWAYAVAYRITGDEFMWKMTRDIASGNSFGDLGTSPSDTPQLQMATDCSDVHGLLGFLNLYEKTRRPEFLEMAQQIGDNIVEQRFHKGFFVPSQRQIYTKFDYFEPLALLHLVAIKNDSNGIPRVWPSCPLFVPAYRYREQGIDRLVIYALTETAELPLSLREAVNSGDIKLLQSVLDEGADVNEEGPEGTALHYAVGKGDTQVVQLLIAHGADVNAEGRHPQGNTPLHVATRQGKREIAILLINRGADINIKNSAGKTPLDLATSGNRSEIAKLLIEKGAVVNNIHTAVSFENIEKVRSLVETGVDVNEKDDSGMTPLLRAVAGKHTEVAEFLIESGADVNAGNKQSIVPLYRALWNRDLAMVKLLLENGADVNAQHVQTGYTPLHWAVMMDNKEIVELLLGAGADVNAKSNSKETPLDVAAYGVSPAIGELLMAKGATISSLHAAAYMGDLAKVKSFIDEGADVNQKKGMFQNTALHSAAAGGRTEVTEFLISKGSDVNAQNRAGGTPLHMAAEGGHLDVTRALLAGGADPDAKNRGSRTPLDLAREAKHTEIVRLLDEATLIHDVAVTEVSAPTTCVQGETISVSVILENRGDIHESTNVRLVDTANDREIGQQSITVCSRYKGASEADLIIIGEVEDETEFGIWCNAEGDVNGDGFTDLLITANHYPAMSISKGRAYLYYGGPNMDGTADKRFTGEERGDTFGDNAGFLVDMNNDGFADVILGARYHDNRGRVYVFWGGADMDEKPDIIIDPPSDDGTGISFGRGGMHPGDFNGDGIMDLVCSAVRYRGHIGRVYLYYGPLAADSDVDKMFTGEGNDAFGAIIGVGDIDGDNCDDLLIATRYHPANTGIGRAYLYYASLEASMDTAYDVLFEPPGEGKNNFGSSADVFDIDNDGYDDVLIGARRYSDGNSIGKVYVYWGKPTGFDDTIGMTITGEAPYIALGGDFINCLYANNDEYGDILVTAYQYNREQSRAYLYLGGPQDTIDAVADYVFTPEIGRNGVFRSVLADLNGDGHSDVVMSGCYYNNSQGRAWLWYGPFASSTKELIINWDTTNASMGKHTLKVEILPVPGEQNTEDNVKTVEIEVKSRQNK